MRQASLRRSRWWVFTNWAVLIGYIILFNLIVTFLLAVLNRAFPAPYDAFDPVSCSGNRPSRT